MRASVPRAKPAVGYPVCYVVCGYVELFLGWSQCLPLAPFPVSVKAESIEVDRGTRGARPSPYWGLPALSHTRIPALGLLWTADYLERHVQRVYLVFESGAYLSLLNSPPYLCPSGVCALARR